MAHFHLFLTLMRPSRVSSIAGKQQASPHVLNCTSISVHDVSRVFGVYSPSIHVVVAMRQNCSRKQAMCVSMQTALHDVDVITLRRNTFSL